MPTYKNDTNGQQTFFNLSGALQFAQPGESVETYKILGAGWTKTADAPFYPVCGAVHEVTAAGAETKTQAVAVSMAFFEIRADVDVVVHANAADAPGYPLQAGGTRVFSNPGSIAAMVLDFSGAGTVTIIELQD
ncbi:MAG: hypothetical protein WC340_17915 [Kiritimatiellia bacterium]